MLPYRLFLGILGVLPWPVVGVELLVQLCTSRHARRSHQILMLRPSQINCFLFVALYIALKATIKSPWVGYDDMDFSEFEAIREEAKFREAQTSLERRVPLWRRIFEKVADQ